MGRPNHHKSRSKNRKNDQDDDITIKKSSQRWDVLPETNLAFVEYYKTHQRIVETEEEWNQLFTSFRTDLPTTFRVTGGKKNATQLNKIIQDTYVPFLSNIRINDELIPPPQKISWYPNGFAWEFRASKQLIRKSHELKKFQNFLVYETEAGNLSRQEAVSMIPPLLLDVQSHHFVLDACAAPGSKTAQLVESLHRSDPGLFPKGLLIANDSDYKRSYLLVHQSLRRLPSPSTMITNHDASRFPTLSMNQKKLIFDRILCDVPCSGDGTLRKNGGIWRDWTPANGIGLHGLQLRILSRMISLLKPGGRIVYSTCSLNPLENEAVVSAALSQFPSMSLKDVSSCLPALIRRPGMTSWTVTTRDPNNLQPIASSDDIPDLQSKKKYPSTLWPSGREAEHGLQNCLRIYPHLQDTGGFFVAVLEKSLGSNSGQTLENTQKPVPIINSSPVKIDELQTRDSLNSKDLAQASSQASPQDHQTSGAPHEARRESHHHKRESTTVEVDASSDEPDCKRVKLESQPETQFKTLPITGKPIADHSHPFQAKPSNTIEPKSTLIEDFPENPFKEEPHVYLKSGNEEIKRCIDYYDINPSFPVDNLLVRNAEGVPTRTIYLTSPVVREVIENNSFGRLRLICSGVKIFGRQDPSSASTTGTARNTEPIFCKWRVVSDGIEYFRPFMGSKRVVRCHINVLKQLIMNEQQYPLIENLDDLEFKEQVQKLEMGSCVAEVFDDKNQQNVPLDLMVGLWISKASLNLMVDKKERKVLSLRLWGEDLTPTTNNSTIEKSDPRKNGLEQMKVNTPESHSKKGEGGDDKTIENRSQIEPVRFTEIQSVKEEVEKINNNEELETYAANEEDETKIKSEPVETKTKNEQVETKIKDEEVETRIKNEEVEAKIKNEEVETTIKIEDTSR